MPTRCAEAIALLVFRLIADLSQEEVAAIVGLSEKTICEYERGGKGLSEANFRRLVEALGFGEREIDRVLRSVREAVAARAGEDAPEDPLRDFLEDAVWEGGRWLLGELRAAAEAARWQRERERGEALWKRLKRHPRADRLYLVAAVRAFRHWSLGEALCEQSRRAAGNRADAAVELAELALKVGEHADLDPAGRARLQGYAWAFIGNARRVGGDLPSAEEAFVKSDALWKEGEGAAGPPLDVARLWDLKASLRREQGRCEESLTLLDRALAVASCTGATARLLIKKALAFERQGDLVSAVVTFNEAEPDLAAEKEPRQAFSWVMGFARVLLELERVDEAAALLPRAQALALQLGNELDALRTRWMEARLAEAQGDRPAAITALDGLAAAFLRHKMPFDAALALLEQAVLYLEDGHTVKVKHLTRQLAPVFAAQQVPQEALANLRLFYEAAQHETLTLASARETLALLRRAAYGHGHQRRD